MQMRFGKQTVGVEPFTHTSELTLTKIFFQNLHKLMLPLKSSRKLEEKRFAKNVKGSYSLLIA